MSDDRMDEFLDEFLSGFKKATGIDLKSGEIKWEEASTCHVCPSKECVDCPAKNRPEENKIQGYTAEQWQEIIDGGYLCEFAPDGHYNRDQVHIDTVNHYDHPQLGYEFYSEHHGSFQFCRPAQIKGVMRPIFVEPVGDPYCVFFDVDGRSIIAGMARWSLFKEGNFQYHETATKYIEV